MANEFVYTMQGLSKTTSRGKSILKDIWLSFLPGAKIGVLGLNGSGKSTLLRIMAGEDKEFTGEAYPLAGVKIGYLPQEPQLDESKTVKENVEEGVAEFRAIVDQFNEVSMKFGEVSSDEEMNALFEEQGRLQDIIDSKDLWDLDRHVGIAMDALNVPVDAETSTLSVVSGDAWRWPGCCWRGPTCCCWTSPPTTSTPTRSPGWSSSSRSTPAPWWR